MDIVQTVGNWSDFWRRSVLSLDISIKEDIRRSSPTELKFTSVLIEEQYYDVENLKVL